MNRAAQNGPYIDFTAILVQSFLLFAEFAEEKHKTWTITFAQVAFVLFSPVMLNCTNKQLLHLKMYRIVFVEDV